MIIRYFNAKVVPRPEVVPEIDANPVSFYSG